MRVLLDCDGVLGDYASEVIRFVNMRVQPERPFTIHDAADFSILESLGFEHLQDELDRHIEDTYYCATMPVLPGAVEFVNRLYQLNHEVVIVTSQHMGVPLWCSQRMAWLWKHFGIHADDVIFARRKHRIEGDVLVDDKPENLVSFGANAILFDQPWNQDAEGVYRAKSYQDVVARLRWIDAA